jgi:hypothetical protein
MSHRCHRGSLDAAINLLAINGHEEGRYFRWPGRNQRQLCSPISFLNMPGSYRGDGAKTSSQMAKAERHRSITRPQRSWGWKYKRQCQRFKQKSNPNRIGQIK